MIKKGLVIFSVIALSGCCGVKYQEYQPLSGGYEVTDISKREFLIVWNRPMFNTNDFLLQNQYAIRRAAEKTLELGFSHFTCTPWENSLRVHCYAFEEAPREAYDASKVVRFQIRN